MCSLSAETEDNGPITNKLVKPNHWQCIFCFTANPGELEINGRDAGNQVSPATPPSRQQIGETKSLAFYLLFSRQLKNNTEDKINYMVAIERKIFRARQQIGETELLAIYLLFFPPIDRENRR